MKKKFVFGICLCLISACRQAETFTKTEDGETFFYFQAESQDVNQRLCEKSAEVKASRKVAAALKQNPEHKEPALLSGVVVEDKQSFKKNGKFICKVTVKISETEFKAAGKN